MWMRGVRTYACGVRKTVRKKKRVSFHRREQGGLVLPESTAEQIYISWPSYDATVNGRSVKDGQLLATP